MRVASLALALVVSGCAAAPPAEQAPVARGKEVLLEPSEPVDPLAFEPSGRTISGVYVEEVPRPPAVTTTWAFTASGGYATSSELGAGRVAQWEAGSYTIDRTGRLVLYVEQRGDARLTTARRFVYDLEGDPAGVLTIRSPEGWSARLVRSGDEPETGDATTAGR